MGVISSGSPVRFITLAGILFVLLIVIAFVSSIVTRDIANRAKQQQTASVVITPSPTPGERSIYLNLPESFPKDMPLVSRSRVTLANEDGTSWSAVLLTTMSLEETRLFYLEELASSGWTITSQAQAAGLSIIYVEKDTLEAIIALGKSEQGIAVSITILKNAS